VKEVFPGLSQPGPYLRSLVLSTFLEDSMLELRIASLSAGVHTFTLRPSAADLDLDPDAFRDLHVDVRLDLTENQAHVVLDTAATASLVCDRTLVDFEQQVQGTHEVVFSSAAAHARDAGAEPAEDVFPLDAGQVSLDLTTPVRDTIMLSLPTRCLAPGAEDADLPTSFGALSGEDGAPVDSRWEALLKLKQND
jgi:uncharacterized protein